MQVISIFIAIISTGIALGILSVRRYLKRDAQQYDDYCEQLMEERKYRDLG